MREIKFRGWNGKEMLDVYYVTRKGIGALGNGGMIIPKDDNSSAIMQFTGLTDINGVEIYEGDICIWYINNLERIGEVYYHDQSFEMRSQSMGYIGWDANRGEIKVIGNIYQNLELLK